ncbi:hypothetical protein C6P46_003655 [Rhodotorula mucilaginosa]|uniref:AN1-type domain-containing protein n=1 Tax=Rhodotorula mucilaginosa TaxID=5537 RepID=A0A9P6WA69_RHOMI|nr:hypothetical protein C6P46_003655 [Rhodotorula mucilaginosa]TKA53844.1 hypothetical protein B0A53_03634 [Rhodotorula sp. CCFEE 5036]
MQSQEFLEIGRHCKEPSCNQLDFLPFKCPSCHLDFCAQHWRPPTGHRCSEYNEAEADNRIPTCPLCSQPVPFPPSQDPNAAMDAHLSTSCPVLLPDKAPSTKKSPNQCSAQGCKTKMIVPIECDECRRKFCPSHRWKSDHACSTLSSSSSTSSSSSSGTSRSTNRDKKGFGGMFARASPNGAGSRPPVAAGLAAIRRAQQARIDNNAKSSPRDGSSLPTRAPKALSAAADPDSDVEIVSYKAAGQTKSTAAGKKALASIGVASKTDKRARAEQESQRKALEVRAMKGLLTEAEKLQYATLQALAQKEGEKDSNCVVG